MAGENCSPAHSHLTLGFAFVGLQRGDVLCNLWQHFGEASDALVDVLICESLSPLVMMCVCDVNLLSQTANAHNLGNLLLGGFARDFVNLLGAD